LRIERRWLAVAGDGYINIEVHEGEEFGDAPSIPETSSALGGESASPDFRWLLAVAILLVLAVVWIVRWR
jgi:hypothetical protein